MRHRMFKPDTAGHSPRRAASVELKVACGKACAEKYCSYCDYRERIQQLDARSLRLMQASLLKCAINWTFCHF